MPAQKFSRLFASFWTKRFGSQELAILSGLALALGLTSGIGVWIFKSLIELVHQWSFEGAAALFPPAGGWVVILIPAVGGLAVGLIVHFFIGEERHHGVAGIMESAALAGGRLRYKRAVAKTIAASIGIGSGASVGPEDPSVQIGANLGSMFGELLRLSDDRRRALVAAGAAAAISAAFNAPIAGVFFALEIILGEISGNALGMVLAAAVISSAFTRAVAGAEPAFHVPAYALQSPWELLLYLGLGLLAGPVSALYIDLLYKIQDLYRCIEIPRWCKTVAAGLIVGGVGFFLPQVFGVGYETIEAILGGQVAAIRLLLVLMLAKLALTPVCIGGGFLGGVFAPSLYIGAALGGAYGLAIDRIFPALGVTPPAFAMVGMAAVLAGSVRAPLTAILLLFEMTNDYRIILPLMFAVAVSLLASQSIQRDSVYTLGLARKGIRLERGRDVEVLNAITVREVMQTDTPQLRESDPLKRVRSIFVSTHRQGLPVVDENGELSGVLTVQDLDQAQAHATVGDACTRAPVTAFEDETLGEALRRMSILDVGRLPVVARENPRRLTGWLRRSDVIRAYDVALSRRAALRHRAQQVRLDAMSGEDVHIVEMSLEAGAPCIARPLKDIAWPADCLIASLRRGRRTIIPHGDTTLMPGDTLVIVAGEQAMEEVAKICRK